MLEDIDKEDPSPSFKSVCFSKLQISDDIFRINLQSPVHMEPPCWCTSVGHQYGGRKIVVNILNKLLWLFRPLIIHTEQKSIYISTFLDTLTSEYSKNHEIGIYFSTNTFVALCHARPKL